MKRFQSRRSSQTQCVKWQAIGLIFLIWASPVLGGIPEKPESDARLHDFGQVISEEHEQTIEKSLEETLSESGISIVIVTIRAMTDFGQDSAEIEEFARLWFESWKLGAQKNDGMLIIVSSEDQETRIQLGSAWGGRFDGFCENLIKTEMVPRFEESNYGSGLIAAVTRLDEIARNGPTGNVPLLDSKDITPWHISLLENKFIKWVFIGCGLALFVCAFASKAHRMSLLTLGSLAIGFGLLSGYMIMVLFLWVVFGPGLKVGVLSIGGGLWSRDGGAGGKAALIRISVITLLVCIAAVLLGEVDWKRQLSFFGPIWLFVGFLYWIIMGPSDH